MPRPWVHSRAASLKEEVTLTPMHQGVQRGPCAAHSNKGCRRKIGGHQGTHTLSSSVPRGQEICLYVCVCVCVTHNGMLPSHKKDKILLFATTWVDLEGTMLSEISRRKTNIV